MRRHSFARRFDLLTVFVLVAALVLVFATFRDYGVAWDAQGETVNGALLVRYYTSWFHDRAAFDFVNFRFYGGGFDLPAALLARALPFGIYETRHLMTALLGVGGLAATWRVARRLGGPRAGALATVLLLASPWYGHMFINARDVPFATGMACCLLLSLHAIEELPEIRRRTAVSFGLSLGFAASIRIGAVLSFVSLLVPIAVWIVARARSGGGRGALLREAAHIAGALITSLAVAYAVIAVLWPWAVQAPLNPLRALALFARFPFDGRDLFEGKLIPADSLPASYLPVLLAMKLPAVFLIGIASAVPFGVRAALRKPRSLCTPAGLGVIAVVVAAAFPVAYFVVFRPVDYNGIRHFLFVLPPLAALAALGLDRALRSAPSSSLRAALAVGLALALIAPVHELVILHPDQYVYFNALAGGPRGAQGRYELDYWGTSLAEAAHRLTAELERRGDVPLPGRPPLKVYVCGNVWSAASFFPAWLSPVVRREDADFQIAIAQFYCGHPPGSRLMLGITRAGALLSYVDDLRPPSRRILRPDVHVRSHGPPSAAAGGPSPASMPRL